MACPFPPARPQHKKFIGHVACYPLSQDNPLPRAQRKRDGAIRASSWRAHTLLHLAALPSTRRRMKKGPSERLCSISKHQEEATSESCQETRGRSEQLGAKGAHHRRVGSQFVVFLPHFQAPRAWKPCRKRIHKHTSGAANTRGG